LAFKLPYALFGVREFLYPTQKGDMKIMKSIVNALYNGRLFPAEQVVFHDKRYRFHMDKQITACEKLSLSLTPDQRKLLEKYKDCTNILNAYILQRTFQKGFKIGAKMILEVERR